MGKEELMKYANDPFWIRLRWTVFALFWVLWIAMLLIAIIIVVRAPKCPAPAPLEYWQKGTLVIPGQWSCTRWQGRLER